MKKVLLLFCLSIFSFTLQSQQVLIYTHNGEGYVHDNIKASTDALLKIGKENNLQMSVSEDPEFFTESKLENLDLIIFNNTNNEAFYSDAQREAFRSFIENGGAFVGIHISTGSERDWPWFWKMQGGKFRSHPEFQSFDIHVIDDSYPSTAFLDKIWKWEDECYYFDHLNPAINILLAADLRTIEDDKKEDYPGTVFGDFTPLAWYHHFGKARVFYTALGHDIKHYQNPEFLKHLEEGIKWTLKNE